MGRPKEGSLFDKYIKGKEDFIKAQCRNGATNISLSKNLGIGITTFKRILKENPEIMNELLVSSKMEADLKVESALFKRAVGYEYEETKTIITVDKEGNANPARIEKIKRVVIPDTTAQIFWLKNRNPDKWRDKNICVHEGDNKNPIKVTFDDVLKDVDVSIKDEELK